MNNYFANVFKNLKTVKWKFITFQKLGLEMIFFTLYLDILNAIDSIKNHFAGKDGLTSVKLKLCFPAIKNQMTDVSKFRT